MIMIANQQTPEERAEDLLNVQLQRARVLGAIATLQGMLLGINEAMQMNLAMPKTFNDEIRRLENYGEDGCGNEN